MDDNVLSLLEQLANTTIYNTESQRIVHNLPTDLKNFFIESDFQHLRKKLSGRNNFLDSKVVTMN